MAAQTDFWGEIVPGVVRTPLSILREQAALLGTKTKNLVEAKVKTTVDTSDATFTHSFALVAPSLDNYTYVLFRISHDVNLYPVSVWAENRELGTEQEFTQWLQAVLSSEKTQRIVRNLLAQVTN